MKKNIGVLFVLLLIYSCSGTSEDNGKVIFYPTAIEKKDAPNLDSMIQLFCTQRIELRDSMYIVYTIMRWHDSDFDVWRNMPKLFKMKNEDVKPYVSAVFYSPDRKKMVFWLGEKMPNAATNNSYSKEKKNNRLEPSGDDTIYTIIPMIGFRDGVNKPWTLSKLPGRETGADTKKEADEELALFLFINLKYQGIRRVIQSGTDKGKIELQPYGYNLQDKDFWNKCWVLQKDTVGSDGLYPFQEDVFDNYNSHPASEGVYRCFKCATNIPPPKIEYTKEILDMYDK